MTTLLEEVCARIEGLDRAGQISLARDLDAGADFLEQGGHDG